MINQGKDSLLAAAEEAANWYLILEDEDAVSESDRQGFVDWLRRAPDHIEEFMRVSAMHRCFAEMPVTELPDVKALIDEARCNVVDIGAVETGTAESAALAQKPVTKIPPPPLLATRRRLLSGIAASFMAITALSLWLTGVGFGPLNTGDKASEIIVTGLGEQRSVVLADGSVVNLNTQSRLRVNYSEAVRLVELVAGEAMFDVAKDAARPFRVRSGSAMVEAIGTQFNVYHQHTQTVVTVVEGLVSVSSNSVSSSSELRDSVSRSSDSASSNRTTASSRVKTNKAQAGSPVHSIDEKIVRLAPGNQVSIALNGAIAAKTTVRPKDTTAWTKRRLVFNGDSLEVVARELNRYNAKQLTIADRRLSQRAISGIFNANDPAALVAFLAEIGGLHVETDGNGWALYLEATNQDSPAQ